MNKWLGIGRLCGDPEIRNTDSGKAIANYRIAVNRDFKKDGQPDADFLNCVAFGKAAEFAGKYLHKGTKVAVEGRIQTRDYLNKDGQKVYVTEIVVDRHEFCEKKEPIGGNYGGYSVPELPTAPAQDFETIEDDDAQLLF